MNPEGIEQLLRTELANCEVQVAGSGSHYDIVVIGEVFQDLRPVKKQQIVYAVLAEYIASGAIHAVNIKTYTPGEWAAKV